MQVEINTFIQEHLKQLTNKTFSKKYISQYIAPIINNINIIHNNHIDSSYKTKLEMKS